MKQSRQNYIVHQVKIRLPRICYETDITAVIVSQAEVYLYNDCGDDETNFQGGWLSGKYLEFPVKIPLSQKNPVLIMPSVHC